MRFFILLFGLGLFLFSASYAASSTPQNLLADINAYRVEHGMNKLKMNNVLVTEAEIHSQEMARNTIPFGHEGFNVRAHRIVEQFKQVKGIAENVAYTDLDTQDVVKLWISSSGHRKNIEGNYNLTGIGIARDKNGRTYFTQIFLKIAAM